jgi:hypothetical protein
MRMRTEEVQYTYQYITYKYTHIYTRTRSRPAAGPSGAQKSWTDQRVSPPCVPKQPKGFNAYYSI